MNMPIKFLLSIIFVSSSATSAISCYVENEQAAQEPVNANLENKNDKTKLKEIYDNIYNNIKDTKLGQLIKNNPKKFIALTTFLTFEAIGFCLIYSRFGTDRARALPIWTKLLCAPVCGPYLPLHGVGNLLGRNPYSEKLVPVISFLKLPIKQYVGFITDLAKQKRD